MFGSFLVVFSSFLSHFLSHTHIHTHTLCFSPSFRRRCCCCCCCYSPLLVRNGLHDYSRYGARARGSRGNCCYPFCRLRQELLELEKKKGGEVWSKLRPRPHTLTPLYACVTSVIMVPATARALSPRPLPSCRHYLPF